MGSTIEGFDVFGVHGDGSGAIFHDFVPVTESIVAGGSVRVVDGIRFAEDGFAI